VRAADDARLVAPAEVLAALDARHDDDLAALVAFLRIPSVSTDPRHDGDVRRAAAYLTEFLADAGLADAALLETPRHPVVTASWRGAPGAPTVLVYGHYDVQPPDPLAAWTSPPFEPTVRDGRLYARGASDDKAPVFVALTAIAAYLRATGALPVNVVLLLEGEEEIGSPSLPDLVVREAERFRADLVLSADGGMWRADHPTTMISSRGLVTLECTVRGAAKDLHSGRHGGGVANPLHALARLVASLHDDGGRVAVAGFYDDVRPIPEATRAALRALPFDDATYLAEVGAPATFGEAGYGTLERQWNRPTLEVNGLWGGYTGEGSKTVLPSVAHAKLSCRLVADQDPAAVRDAVVRHLHAHLPPGVTLEVAPPGAAARAYRLPDGHPGLATAIASLRAVYGVAPWVVGMGGTLPIVETFQRELDMDTVFFSFAVGDEDIHAPNEFFRLARFAEGRRAWADYLARFPQAGDRAAR
jgi:acetylornithine deacetylase/succinyl-diaminopimelate desuccinylase-like protein